MTSANALRSWPLLVPIAVMADSSIWQGWTALGQLAGMGWLTTVLDLSVIGVVTYALVQRVRSRSVRVRRTWTWVMVSATAGTALGAALAARQEHAPMLVSVLVWLTPLACTLAAIRLYVLTREEVPGDAV